MYKNLYEFQILVMKFLFNLTVSSDNLISFPWAASDAKVNLRGSAPYLFISSIGSIIFPFDLDIFCPNLSLIRGWI